MKTTCSLNSIICPNCGHSFETEELYDYSFENKHTAISATYKELCPNCDAVLMIGYELQKWFTAQKLKDI